MKRLSGAGTRSLRGAAIGTLMGLVAGLAVTGAGAQQPLVKRGACPSGYHVSGDYCAPSSRTAAPAIAREGACPSGYHVSGDYCLGNGPNAKTAVPRRGACPSGYHVSGDYCLEN